MLLQFLIVFFLKQIIFSLNKDSLKGFFYHVHSRWEMWFLVCGSVSPDRAVIIKKDITDYTDGRLLFMTYKVRVSC